MSKRLAAWALVWWAVPALAQPAPDASADAVRSEVRDWREAHEKEILREYLELLAIPNLASDAVNIRRNAERIAAMLERRGVKTRLLDGEGGPPVVYGELGAPGATKTIVLYAHYDGQPVDPAEWKTAPWKPVLRDGPLEAGGREIALESLSGTVGPEWRLYGRSTIRGWRGSNGRRAAIRRRARTSSSRSRRPS